MPKDVALLDTANDPLTGARVRVISTAFLQLLNSMRDASNTTLLNIGSGGLGPALRNMIVDGSFEVWDGARAPANFGAVTNGYTGCTMWSYNATTLGGAGANSVSRRVGVSSPFCLRYQRTLASGSGVAQNLYYDMESVNSGVMAGKKITISFRARAGADFSPTGKILTSSIQTGTGTDEAQRTSTYTGSVITTQANALTVDFQTFTMTARVPSNATQIGIGFSHSNTGFAGAADYYEIDDVQLEESVYATQFERQPFGAITKLIERYYRKSFEYDTAPAQNAGLPGAFTFPVVAPGAVLAVGGGVVVPKMRGANFAAARITFYNPAAANAFVRNVTLATDATTTASVNEGQGGFGFTQTGLAAWAVGNQLAVHYQMDGRL